MIYYLNLIYFKELWKSSDWIEKLKFLLIQWNIFDEQWEYFYFYELETSNDWKKNRNAL